MNGRLGMESCEPATHSQLLLQSQQRRHSRTYLLLRLCSCAKHSPVLSLRATMTLSSRRFLLLIRQETSHKHGHLSLRRGEYDRSAMN